MAGTILALRGFRQRADDSQWRRDCWQFELYVGGAPATRRGQRQLPTHRPQYIIGGPIITGSAVF